MGNYDFLVLAEDFNLYVSLGALQDLTELAYADDDFDAGGYYLALLSYGEYAKRLYVLPCGPTGNGSSELGTLFLGLFVAVFMN